ncbi:MAG: hypothetical protein ABW061_18420 [Polyangiaceae bacterium]
MLQFLFKNVRRTRLAGVARVAAYLALINLGISYLLMRSAYAGAERAVQRLGSQLTKQLGSQVLGEPQAVSVNGQLLLLAAKETELSVKAVLDQFDAHCEAHSGGLRAEFEKIPGFEQRKLALPEAMRDPGRIGIIRSDAGHTSDAETEAHLVCIAQPRDGGGLVGLLKRVNEFMATGDASRIGDMRYVAARKQANGKTQVIAIWTEGKFNIEAMFPDQGDAPGTDAPDFPRPPNAVRSFSAFVPDHPYAVRFYDSTEPQARVLSFYDQELTKAGWTTRPSSMTEDGPELHGAGVRAYTRGGRAVAVSAQQDGPGQTGVSVIELGRMERVVAEAVTLQ